MDRERTPRATDNDGLLLGGLDVGARIGPYVIEQHLPTRGTGHLYAATHLVLPRHAVIKVLPAMASGAQQLAVELLREACIVDAIDHPGVPRLYESGMLADRRPWVAIERIDGTSLATMLDGGPLPMTAALAVIRDVADILVHVHAQGLVHCNVVPSSIIYPHRTRRFPLCLVDWSVARALDSTRPSSLAPARECLGYLAPEQLHGSTVTDRADVFALGMIARELRTDVPGEAPPLFIALVERMVDPDPAQRPSSAEVRSATGWLFDQVEEFVAEPPQAEPAPRAQLITSELTVQVSGEISVRE